MYYIINNEGIRIYIWISPDWNVNVVEDDEQPEAGFIWISPDWNVN